MTQTFSKLLQTVSLKVDLKKNSLIPQEGLVGWLQGEKKCIPNL